MKLQIFNYTDLKDKQSHRKVLVTSSPTDKVSGIDVTDCTDEEIAVFAAEYDHLHDEFLKQIEALKEEFDLKHNYRQFLENRISETIVEII